MPLPKEKSKPKTSLGEFTALLYGASKIGKCVGKNSYLVNPITRNRQSIAEVIEKKLPVYSYDGKQLIIKTPSRWIVNKPDRLFEVITKYGYKIETTEKHPFLFQSPNLNTPTWVELKDLKVGDSVGLIHDYTFQVVKYEEIVSIRHVGTEEIFDLEVPDTHNFIANDFVVHNSTFCSNFPDAVFLATEPGLNSLEVYKSDILTWEGFLSDCGELAKGKHNFKTVIIDTIDNLYKFCSESICKQFGIKHESDLGFGKGFSLVNSEFQRVLTRLSLLPMGLVLISHSQEKEIETRTAKIKRTLPTLPDSPRKIVLGLVDMILFCDLELIKDEETGKIVGHRRVIRTKPHALYEAGDRTKRLPEVIDLDYNKFIEAFCGK